MNRCSQQTYPQTLPPPALLASGPDPSASATLATDLEAAVARGGGDPRAVAVERYRAERGNLLRAARVVLRVVGGGVAPAA